MGLPSSLFLLLVPLLIYSPVEGRYKCKDLNGKQVDWFVAYKLPTGIANANGGKNFVYADSNNPSWQLSRKTIDDPDSAIGATVSQAYGDDTSSFVLMYSDDGPTTPVDSYRGHAKGVLVFDGSTGFWLVHSVPNFPGMTGVYVPSKHQCKDFWNTLITITYCEIVCSFPFSDSYIYPPTGFKFAQSFLCVSVATDNLAAIGEQLTFIQASPFKSQLPDKFGTRFPVLRTVLAKKSLPPSATIFTSTKHIQTEGGTAFHVYAKHKKYKQDLWHDLVATDQGVSLGVQTWLNGGADDLHSSCRRDGVNVFDITDLTIMGANFSSSKDHSKWAVSDAARRPVVCVGDLNRQKSQLSRGGGALCLEHAALWRTYRGTVRDVEACMAEWARGGAEEGTFGGVMKIVVYLGVVMMAR